MFSKKRSAFTRTRKTLKAAKAVLTYRKKYCRFCVDKIDTIDYKDKVLEKLISERGKILSRRFTGNCARHQRLVAKAIKQARFIALLSYIKA